MPRSTTRLRELPHFRVNADAVASWLEDQGDQTLWSVDGDPLLTQMLYFPCTSGELARALRRIGKGMLVLDSSEKPAGAGEVISADRLDDLAFIDRAGDRVFQFCWENGPDLDWLLVEDIETSESYSGNEEAE